MNMSTAEKTLERMRRNPRDWRIEDVIAVARKYNLLMRAEGGSHHVFSFPGIKDSVSIPAHKPIKPVYIKQFVELIDKAKE
jgi:hypothetical protein